MKNLGRKTGPVRSADLTGEVCPMTFVKVKLHLEQIRAGETLEVILREGEHMRNVPRSVKDEGHKIVEVKPLDGGRYRLLVVRDGGQVGEEEEEVTSFVKGLKCMEADCGREYPKEPRHICEFCFGKLQVDYDYDAVAEILTRDVIQSREPSMWRYRELLPIDGDPQAGHQGGFTPLVRARGLERALGHDARSIPRVAPARKLVDERLGNVLERGEPASQVAVQRCIAHAHLALVARSEQEPAVPVAQRHQQGPADPSLKILSRQVTFRT